MNVTLLEIAQDAVDRHGALQKPAELAGLLGIAVGLEPRVVCEIGTAGGGLLWALACALPAGRTFVSVDLPGGPGGGAQGLEAGVLTDLLRDPGEAARVIEIHGDSKTVELAGVPPIDLLLIDGDHSPEGVRSDWLRFSRLVLPGGLIGLHDVVEHPAGAGVFVEPFWRQLLETEPATLELVSPTGGSWGGWGIVFR